MQFFTFFSSIITIFIFIHSCQAFYNPSSKSNIALYWGQGAGQQRLSYFCAKSTVDVIPIAFVDVFPAQGNGFPGTNFGNQCWGPPYIYPGPSNNPSLNQLQSECPNLVADIPICQGTYSKKIVLSLGGASQTYQLTGAPDGVAFADFLWGAFGPQTPSWLASGQPRPFDGPNGQAVEVDGFDFDIEIPSTDAQAGYIAMASRLRTLFKRASKLYLLTGAPQCIVPDANMGALMKAVAFDIIWVQFYNTPQCSARSWITANPNYVDGKPEVTSGFGYYSWTTFLDGTASKAAKLYIGVLGAPDAKNYYLSPSELSSLVDVYYCDGRFGGVMIWEATTADTNAAGPYYSAAKSILTGYDSKPPRLCPPATSTTSSAKSATKTTVFSANISSSRLPTSTAKKTVTNSSKTTATISISSQTSKSTKLPRNKTTSKSSSSTLTTKIISKSTSLSASPSPSAPAGACGLPYGVSCSAGHCCSQYGYCGNGVAYCSTGCQPAFGICG